MVLITFVLSHSLSHLCRMYFPILINWTSPFPILWLLGGIFHFYSSFERNFCLQTVENLIRRRVLWRLIWFCHVCRCDTKRTLGLYRLILSKHTRVCCYRICATPIINSITDVPSGASSTSIICVCKQRICADSPEPSLLTDGINT